MSTEGSGFDTVLAVYAGSTLGAAGNNRIDFHDDISVYQRQSRLRFDAVAGTQYMIAVDGAELSDGAQGGLVVFSINPSGNDEFSTRAELTGQQASVLGYIGNATHEPGEPQHGPTPGEGSLWYEWTAPASGPVVFHTIGSDVDTFLSIYSGSDLPSLAMVVRDDDSGGYGTSRVEWSAVQGQRYQIAVDRKSGTLSPSAKLVIRLSWEAATIQQAPSISKPPSSITTVIGSNVLFTVSATGTLPLTYQWSFGGAPLLEGQGVQGVQSPNLVLSDIDELDRGLYQVEVSNSLGRALSPAVNLVAASATRVIFVEPMIVSPGDVVPVQVSIASQSAEHSVAFSLSFDPGRISDPQISLDPGLPATTALQVDPSLAQAGFVGVRVLLPPGLALATGKHRLVTMHCRVANGIPDEERLRICFEDSPVRREVLGTLAQALSTSYGCGSLIAATRDILS
ncbi:MAG: immunoglobulin domain-containing protein, partial [Verrucomicrobia bacterium]|nr:immunoglobulin domain-containing protein [Verrucomicrobiota bacterium]